MLRTGVVYFWLCVCCYVGAFPRWTSSTKCCGILEMDLHSTLVWCCKGQKARRSSQHCSEADPVENSLGLSDLQNIRYYPFFCVEWKKRWTSLGCTVRKRGRARPWKNFTFSWPFTMKEVLFRCILQDYIAFHYTWWLHLNTQLNIPGISGGSQWHLFSFNYSII